MPRVRLESSAVLSFPSTPSSNCFFFMEWLGQIKTLQCLYARLGYTAAATAMQHLCPTTFNRKKRNIKYVLHQREDLNTKLLASKYSTSDLSSYLTIKLMQFDTRPHSKDTNAWSESVCVYILHIAHTQHTHPQTHGSDSL